MAGKCWPDKATLNILGIICTVCCKSFKVPPRRPSSLNFSAYTVLWQPNLHVHSLCYSRQLAFLLQRKWNLWTHSVHWRSRWIVFEVETRRDSRSPAPDADKAFACESIAVTCEDNSTYLQYSFLRTQYIGKDPFLCLSVKSIAHSIERQFKLVSWIQVVCFTLDLIRMVSVSSQTSGQQYPFAQSPERPFSGNVGTGLLALGYAGVAPAF